MVEEKFACGLHCLLSLFRKQAEVNYLYINHTTEKNFELVDFEISIIQAMSIPNQPYQPPNNLQWATSKC